MARSEASTVEDYLSDLPEERRAVVSAVRDLVRENLPEGYRETMNWGMISYEIPLERYPNTYNDRPLGYVALAAQRRHYALHLHGVYMDPELKERLVEAFAESGKELDMGKSCLRFRTLDDLARDAVAEIVAAVPPERLIERYEAVRRR